MKPDFSGYATKSGILCSDGRTIMPDAFKHFDGRSVPLVWQHGHTSPTNVLGHAKLENRKDGVYADGFFNDSENAAHAKAAVMNGDIKALSIFANQLREENKHVMHGNLVEVSLVISGANPGAVIDNVYMQHSDGDESIVEGAAVITSGETLQHSDEGSEGTTTKSSDEDSSDEKTVEDVLNELSEDQLAVVEYLVKEAASDDDDDNDDEDDTDDSEGEAQHMNVFENAGHGATQVKAGDNILSHSDVREIMQNAQDMGSLRKSLQSFVARHDDVLQHAESLGYGIDNLEFLFPDAKAMANKPEVIQREMDWVNGVLSGARKVPFSRIKTLYADITEDEARARGYITGDIKKEEFFGIAKRETSPTTIYKKQRLDRDDIIDVTTLDIVAWLWQEMRVMLNEEIARAILIGDGRAIDSPDKVNPQKIRPIATDHEFFTHKIEFDGDILGENFVKELIKSLTRSKRHYKGSGRPTFYTSEHVLTEMLLEEDQFDRRLYNTEAELASAIRVDKIVTLDLLDPEYLKGQQIEGLIGIMVNMADYTIGTDKGGEIAKFDDFDIDFNQYKYLLEGRMSGSLTKHKSAISIWKNGTVIEEGENVSPARKPDGGFPPVDQPQSNHPQRRPSGQNKDNRRVKPSERDAGRYNTAAGDSEPESPGPDA